MNRLVIIGGLAFAALWGLVAPWLVGLYLQHTLHGWAEQQPAGQTLERHRGWFSTQVNWSSDDGVQIEARLRHAPVLRPGLVRLDGQIRSPLTPAAAPIHGQLGLTGSWHLQLQADALVPAAAGGLAGQALEFNLSQAAGQPLTMIFRAERFGHPGQTDDLPALDELRLMGRRVRLGDGVLELGLDLELTAGTLGKGRLTLAAGPVQEAALSELFDGLGALLAGAEDELSARLAWLGIIGAWQQLAAGGLQISLERLELGTETHLRGSWQAGQSVMQLDGQGQMIDLREWYRVLAVRLAGRSAADADLEADAWITTLQQAGWLRAQGSAFELSTPAS